MLAFSTSCMRTKVEDNFVSRSKNFLQDQNVQLNMVIKGQTNLIMETVLAKFAFITNSV